MGFVKLEPPCPQKSFMVPSVDPDPNWTLDDLLTELRSIESRLGGAAARSPLKQPPESMELEREPVITTGSKPFVMGITDDDIDFDDDEPSPGSGTRFSCVDLNISDSEESEDELYSKTTPLSLMRKKTMEEGILSELELEDQLKIKEQVRSKLSVIELQQKHERERMMSAMLQIEKYTETRKQMDKRMDQQYHRKIAEVTDRHLSAVQRDHEQISQIEERRIKDDAALEEAKQKEKAREEKAKAEAEARLKVAKRAEEEKVAQEAARRAHEEAAEKEATRIKELAAAEIAEKAANQLKVAKESGIRVLAEETALKAEANRVKLYNEVAESIRIPQKDFERQGRQMFRFINQIGGTLEIARSKARVLLNTINDPAFPPSISMLIFAQKMVSLCETPRGTADRTAFACAHVIILVTSQVPALMDFVLAELHNACIYTVPKHFLPSDAASQTKDYWKLIGYREEDNKMETTDIYLSRMQSYMKLYAAIVQTQIRGFGNPHGLEEGWAWLARFLNCLPASRSSASALYAFLKIAGFAMFRRYRSQFVKILNIIEHSYLPKLKEREGQKVGKIVNELEQYLEGKSYLREPEGWRLEESPLLSEEVL